MANKSILVYFLLVGFIILNLLSAHSRAQLETEISMDFKAGVDDPDNVLANWNSEIEGPDPCEWFHVSCNDNQRVIRLDLGDSRISGPISPRLAELTYLENLDLYRSSFNGTLPDSLGNLKFLKEFDVSKNQLTGHIPGTFNELSSLHIFNVSYNKLNGPVPTGSVFKQFGFSSYEGNPRLCGTVVGRPCSPVIETRK